VSGFASGFSGRKHSVRSDPRIGLYVSLAVAAAGALWLVAQSLVGDALWAALGNGEHVITFVAILLIVAGPLVALLFRRYARVKADLVAGRSVIARWTIDPGAFKAVSRAAAARDLAEKRGALMLILALVAIMFGAVALFDPDTAPFMLATAAVVIAVVTAAFWLGNRIQRSHRELRSGEMIVGRDGLLANDVLHVWRTPLSWLADVKLERTPQPCLTVTYGYWTRVGAQFQSVMLPLPHGGEEEVAAKVERAFASGVGGGMRRNRTRRNARPHETAAGR
jgi:hypothetical protein